MPKKIEEKQEHWLNQSQAAKSSGISVQAFVKWGVKPAAKIGRENFYLVSDILANRLEKQADNLKQAYDDPDQSGLERERLRLTRAQADNMEIKNEVARGKTAPIEIIQVVLSRISGEAAGELDGIPLSIKRKHPDVSNQMIEDIKRHCVKAQNAIAECGEVLDAVLDDYLSDSDAA